jgi:hypothetical protein
MDSNSGTTGAGVRTSRRSVLQTAGGAGALSVAGVAAAGGGSGDGPTAAFTADPSSPLLSKTEVTLNASDSTGDIESYEWYRNQLWTTQASGSESATDDEPTATGEVVTLTLDPPVEVELRVVSTDGTTDRATKEFSLPPRICGPSGPLDIDGDGLYEAVVGNNDVTILDVQALFKNLDSECVQNNPGAFNFSGTDPDGVSILDVQAHYNLLQQGGIDGFSAESAGGFVWFGEPDREQAIDDALALPPTPEVPDPVVLSAELVGNRRWEATSVDVPPLDSLPIPQIPTLSTPDGLAGTVDLQTGRLTAAGELLLTIPREEGPTYEVTIPVNATTGESGQLRGSFERRGLAAAATLVDNESVVSDQTGNRVLDALLGLDGPAEESGANWLSLTVDIEF